MPIQPKLFSLNMEHGYVVLGDCLHSEMDHKTNKSYFRSIFNPSYFQLCTMEETVSYIDPFQFKSFTIEQSGAKMKVGTDGVLLGAWVDASNCQRILDIGTGTGVIAIMLAQRNAEAQVTAVEIDREAAALARSNFQNAPWSQRLAVHEAAIQDYSNDEGTFDLIVCNPPFFTGGTLSNNAERANVRHTVKLSHGDLLRSVRRLLSAEGKFDVVLPLIEGLRFKEMAEMSGFHCVRMTEIKGHIDKNVERLLLSFSKRPAICKTDLISINKGTGRHEYTDEYVDLVKDFYTIL